MKIDKNYFTYLLRSKKIAWLFCFVMYMAISLSEYLSIGVNRQNLFFNSLVISSGLSLLMMFVLPIILFAFVHRKRSCDQYFSLPIKRKNLLFTTIAFSFLLTMGYYVATSIVSMVLAWGTIHQAQFISYLVSTAYLAIGTICLLLINSAIYLLANNIFDGIVLLLAYSAIPVLILITSNTILDTLLISFISSFDSNGLLFSPIGIIFYNFYKLVTPVMSGAPITSVDFSLFQNCMVIVYTIVACFLLKKHFIQRKTERAEQTSNTFLSYPFIINFYLLFCLFIIAFSSLQTTIGEFIIVYLVLFFIYIISIFIYKRKLKFYWKNALYFVIAAIVSNSFSHFIYANKAFGLPYLYPTNTGDYLYYNYNYYDPDSQYDEDNDAYTNVSLSFSVEIPVSQRNDAKYKKAFDELEAYRKKTIDHWFDKGGNLANYDAQIFIRSTTNKYPAKQSTSEVLNSMAYQSDEPMSIDTLKTIDKLSPIKVYISNGTDDFSCSLEQYLKEYKK